MVVWDWCWSLLKDCPKNETSIYGSCSRDECLICSVFTFLFNVYGQHLVSNIWYVYCSAQVSWFFQVRIQYSGDGEIVEVAGSFSGWHHRIKMDPQPSSSSKEPVGSRLWYSFFTTHLHFLGVSRGENIFSCMFVTPNFPSTILENGLILAGNLFQSTHFFLLIQYLKVLKKFIPWAWLLIFVR